MENTLLVRHLPSQLSKNDKQELLQHFGAIRVKIMGTKGVMKNTAFLTFPNSNSAAQALSRLHQLEILDCKLVVEFARKSQQKYFPRLSEHIRKNGETKENEKDGKTENIQEIKNLPSDDAVFKKWGINYPRNPKLCYLYPPPTVSILTNIANALAACPKFYVQVLHLMNKMNLPAPFGSVTPIPPVPTTESSVIHEPDNTQTEEMDVSSTEESEIESEGESQKVSVDQPSVKRRIRRKPKISSKRPKFLEDLEIPVQSLAPVMDPSIVFEIPKQHSQVKKIQLNVPETLVHEPQTEKHIPEEPSDVLASLENKDSEGGFGKIEPVKKATTVIEMTDSDLPYTVDPEKFLSTEDIRKGRISKNDMKNFSVFKRYEPGETSSRIYIKNLAKNTTEQDLVNIYGIYINWHSENEKTIFDIRLMKEGRMKGQAFVTFPEESQAEKALNDTNGFVLNGKPMAVQFARSAKVKD